MSSDPVKSTVKASLEFVAEWTEEKVREYAQKFKNRKVAFLQDVETIEIALAQRKTSEWGIFQQNISDGRLRVLFLMGLTLRGLESDTEKCMAARDRIVKKYGAEGLHIAQFVQNGIFTMFIANYLERALTPEQMRQEIIHLFNNIELTNSFVQINDEVGKEAEEIVTRILSHSPKTYVICGLKSVKEKCHEISLKVMSRIAGYSKEVHTTEFKIIIFLHKQEN